MRIKLLRNKPDHALIQMGDGFQAELAVHFLKVCLVHTLLFIYYDTRFLSCLLLKQWVIVILGDISSYVLFEYFFIYNFNVYI